MFSKALTFGLAALALVRAAPASQVAISCNVDFGASVETAKFNIIDGIQDGIYRIYNAAEGAQLRSNDEPGFPVLVTPTEDRVGPYALWEVASVGGPQAFKIRNLGVHTYLQVGFQLEILTGLQGDDAFDAFTIVPGGGKEDTYVVCAVPGGRSRSHSIPEGQRAWPRPCVDSGGIPEALPCGGPAADRTPGPALAIPPRRFGLNWCHVRRKCEEQPWNFCPVVGLDHLYSVPLESQHFFSADGYAASGSILRGRLWAAAKRMGWECVTYILSRFTSPNDERTFPFLTEPWWRTAHSFRGRIRITGSG
ncbi:hypothetical protein B0H17DRAFT_1126465 [Mycena rosella]|uniref:Uncharacterized protein n=1 Tax=Mycena rosella TaxID=1033263 RepID=A0AAD7GT63_MYCRO|nr:hypothetical protein B0H17DRAFT_1126465 [Mycena rosella]